MKKILSLVLVFVFAFSFVSCSSEEVEYYEKQEIQGSYSALELVNKALSDYETNYFIELSFIVGDLSYDENTHYRIFTTQETYSYTVTDNETNQPVVITYPVNIIAITTTPFYIDKTQKGDTITVRAFVFKVSPGASAEYDNLLNHDYPGKILLSPAFVK